MILFQIIVTAILLSLLLKIFLEFRKSTILKMRLRKEYGQIINEFLTEQKHKNS